MWLALGGATFELLAYVFEILQNAQYALPRTITLSLHVDDLNIQATAPSKQQVVADLQKGAEYMIEWFENVRGLPFARAKAFMLASSNDLGRRVLLALRDKAGQYVESARRPGVDYHLKQHARGRHKVRSTRWATHAHRLKLRRVGNVRWCLPERSSTELTTHRYVHGTTRRHRGGR